MTISNEVLSALNENQVKAVKAVESAFNADTKISKAFNNIVCKENTTEVQPVFEIFWDIKEALREVNVKANKALLSTITDTHTKAGLHTGDALEGVIKGEYDATKTAAPEGVYAPCRMALNRAYKAIGMSVKYKGGIVAIEAIKAPVKANNTPADNAPADNAPADNAPAEGLLEPAQIFDKIIALINDMAEVGAMAELKSLQASLATTVNTLEASKAAAAS